MTRAIQLSVACAAVLIASTLSQSAYAAMIVDYHDRSVFDTAVGPTTLEDFGSISVPLEFGSTAVDVGPFSISMSAVLSVMDENVLTLQKLQNDISPAASNIARVLINSSSSLILTFDTPIYAFGADFSGLSDGNQTTLDASGMNVDLPEGPEAAIQFFGFNSDTPFTTLTFATSGFASSDGFRFDNVSFATSASISSVPEPSSLAVFAVGGLIAGAGATRRRRREER
ncbi:PEP-CTERM sorting domain-containing protein [Stieleria varia]|uniref:Ice-binding protein C-terminal domain-containing protein n=1 Tax=Stieleria varia TaxID=2528005 RepID=A0A5C6ANI9_9BACT|nr:PEP-CTERM sorting domain-containing protein [Stieleria varia]TWU00991.1 hypothetical protein Pla52n_43620 [Stieleria varia]